MLVLIAFAHVGVLLLGNNLRMFKTFLQAFSLNMLYLRQIDTGNFIADAPYQQLLLAVYVLAFCLFMLLFSNWVRI